MEPFAKYANKNIREKNKTCIQERMLLSRIRNVNFCHVTAAYFGYAAAKGEREAKERAMEVLHFTGLYDKRYVISKDMGTPDQKRLEMARALATKPEVLFLDENMAGLNPAETEEAIQLIRKINESGVTILLIEHIMKAKEDGISVLLVEQDITKALAAADRGYVIENGRVALEGTAAQLSANEHVKKAYLGI